MFSSRHVSGSVFAPPMSCRFTQAIDAYSETFAGEFELDAPLRAGLIRQLSATDPEGAALLLALGLPAAEMRQDPNAAESAFDRLLAESNKSLIGEENRYGNAVSLSEAALRLAWKKQAKQGFADLISGKVSGSVKLGKHVVVETHKVGRGGELRKGARLKVRIKGMPMSVIQELPKPVIAKSGGKFGTIRIGALDGVKIDASANAVSAARLQSSKVLRTLTSKPGAGILAFGPSAAMDFYDSAQWTDGQLEVNWKGFAVKSAKSQSGNAVGVVAGAAASAGAVALGVVAVAGWPVVLVGLGAGVVAQVAWGYFGADEAAAQQAENVLR
ncbi:MAG: hypothetical protein IV093_17000 [Rubrivivax sp.]|nr:hypothetical protein [Rubrivivax sp.]